MKRAFSRRYAATVVVSGFSAIGMLLAWAMFLAWTMLDGGDDA